jgi:hypothetical protein
MRLSNFKQFNESDDSSGIVSVDEIKDIFADLIDEGYVIKIHTHSEDSAFFEFEKRLSSDQIGAINKNSVYGYANINAIVTEYNKLSILEGIKGMLNSMGYIIGFEFESDITSTSDRNIKIICHLEYDVDWVPEELSEDEIDELDDEEYDAYMRGQGYNI